MLGLGSNKLEIGLSVAILLVVGVLGWLLLQTYLTKTDRLTQSPSQPGSSPPLKEEERFPQVISSKELAKLATTNERIAIIDIRSREAYRAGHLPNAKCIPFDELGIRFQDELNRESVVVIYGDCTECGGQNVTTGLQEMLIQSGFDRVTRLQGGFRGWQEAGFVVQK